MSVRPIGDNRKGGARRALPPLGVLGEFRMAWLIVGTCAFLAIFFGAATWVWVRQCDRPPTQSGKGKMWVTGWMSAGLFCAAVLLTAGILFEGTAMPRRTIYLVLTVGTIVAAFVCGGIHGLISRRMQRLGPDSNYGDFDDAPPPEESLRR